MTTYQPGDSVRVLFYTRDANDNPADASAVNITLTDAAESATTYVYGTHSELTKLATGSYQLLVYVPDTTTSVGSWAYKGKALDGSGNSLTVSRGGFEVG